MRITSILCLCPVLAVNAQLTVTRTHEVVRHPDSITEMSVFDLDGDGDTDILLHGHYNHLTTWCENLGDESFSAPRVIEMRPRTLNYDIPFLADLEGDGLIDLYLEGQTRTRNLGGGGFSTPEALPGGIWPTSPPPYDYSVSYGPPFLQALKAFPNIRNGKDALLVTLPGTSIDVPYLGIYLIDETGSHFTFPLKINGEPIVDESFTYDGQFTIRVMDMDDDGDSDLLVATDDGPAVYRFDGIDNFSGPEPFGDAETEYLFFLDALTINLPGCEFPAVAATGYYYTEPSAEFPYGFESRRITVFTQSESGGQVGFDSAAPINRIELEGDHFYAMAAVPSSDPANGEELWIRSGTYNSELEIQSLDRLQSFQFITDVGWQIKDDIEIPGRGLGEILPMSLSTDGPPGLALRLGGESHVNISSDEKVIWASLDSLRSGTPNWITIAGPFNGFSEFQIADLDRDGKLDLISPDSSHGLGGPKSGRLHFIYDIDGERDHRVIETDNVEQFSGSSLPPGNRVVIGDVDVDLFPDIAISNGPANTISLLRNLGSRDFAAAAPLVTSSNILRPLRLNTTTHLFLEDGVINEQAPSPGALHESLHDLGITGLVVFTDMDDDGDSDVVASPCPLGDVVGWGEVGTSGSIVSWHFLSSSLAGEIKSDSLTPEIGWIDFRPDPVFVRVTEGQPGVSETPLPGPSLGDRTAGPYDGTLWPPVDLDRDGDYDLLALSKPPANENYSISVGPQDLVWHENLGSSWQRHAEPLLQPWYGIASIGSAKIQSIAHADHARVLFSNSQGEVYQLDFQALVPEGSFGSILGSYGLIGASAGAESDPDLDGLTNLEEILQGSSPIDPTPGKFNIPIAHVNPEGWDFSTALNLDGTGISAVTEVSSDLSEWVELPDAPDFISSENGVSTYRISDEMNTESTKRFARVRFTWAPQE